MTKRETYVNNGFNASQLDATKYFVIQAITDALIDDNLPHNKFTLANLDSTSTLFIYLDDFSDQDTPDYVLFPNQQIAVDEDEGVTFTTMFIKNTHATNNVSAKNVKYRISTIKEV